MGEPIKGTVLLQGRVSREIEHVGDRSVDRQIWMDK